MLFLVNKKIMKKIDNGYYIIIMKFIDKLKNDLLI